VFLSDGLDHAKGLEVVVLEVAVAVVGALSEELGEAAAIRGDGVGLVFAREEAAGDAGGVEEMRSVLSGEIERAGICYISGKYTRFVSPKQEKGLTHGL
jgi:hypothetical protein